MPNLPYVSPNLLGEYQKEVASQASPATTKRRMAALKRFFGWAHKEGHIPENPITQASIPPIEPGTQIIPVQKSRFKPLNIFKLGVPIILIVLIFLLARRVKFPIPFLPAPASEPEELTGFTPSSPTPRPVAGPTPQATASGEIDPIFSKIYKDGVLTLEGLSPALKAIGGLLIEGEKIIIKTSDTSDGDIEINPDGSGIAHFLFEGTGQNFLNAQAPNLTSGSLYYGIVANNAAGYDLLRLQSGSKPITRFSVDALGNTEVGGNLDLAENLSTLNVIRLTSAGALTNITGYSQISGNFTIAQAAGDTATITKKASALNDVLTLTLDERGAANSIYSTLTLKRYEGAIEALALFVDEGNARFDGQLQLGRFSSNPTSIGQGSLVFNTGDTSPYVWNGTTWVSLTGGSGGGTIWTREATGVIHPTTSTDSVGIGTSSTTYKLEVSGDVNIADASYLRFGGNRILSGSGGTFTLGNWDGSGNINIRALAATNTGYINIQPFNDYTVTTGTQPIIGITGTFAPTSGTAKFIGLNITPTINQTGTATGDYTAFQVNVTETAATGTNKLLADFQVSATTKLKIDNAGNLTTSGDLVVNGNDITTAAGNLNLQPAGSATTANVQIGAGGAGSATPDLLVLDAKDLTGNPTGTNGAMYYNVADTKFKCFENSAWTNCIGAAGSSSWSALTNPTTDLTLEHTSAGTGFTSTFNWTDTTNNANFFTLSLDNNGGTAGTDQLLVLKNAVSTATTGDLNTEALLVLDQADTTASGPGDTIVDDALLITNSGGSTLTDAIHIGTGTQAIGTAIRIGSTGVTTDIVLQNGETIDNNVDGTIALTTTTLSSGATTVSFASAALTVSSCTGCGGGASTLQAAYEGGNTISVTSAEGNLAFTLTSADFTITTPTGGTNFTSFLRADGAGAADPAQLVLLDNLDIDRAQPIGLKVQSAAGGMTTAIDVSDVEIETALSTGANDLTGTNWSITGATGRLQAGGAAASVAYSRFGTTPATIGAITTASDVLISGGLEMVGGLYLVGKNMYNPQGTAFLTLCIAGGLACGTPSEIEHTLTNGSWTIQNPAGGNVGKAALIVVQNMGGDIFTASAGATTKFTIANNGNVTISGSGTMLTVGGGTGKIDVGTVDPVYAIAGKKFATYMAGMIGVKEETTGNITTSQYIPGIGYRTIVDFKEHPEGSDLWLFSRTTDIKNNIDKLVVLLSPSDNTRAWYEVDKANYTVSIYSARPTTISYRFTAPRFDYADWSNYNDNPEATGFAVDDSPLVGSSETQAPTALALTDFEIVREVPETAYKVYQTISEGSKIVVEEFGAFANLVAGNVKAGAIESKEIATETFSSFQGTIDNLLINGGLVSPVIQTETISPLADKSDVKVKIGNEDVDSGFGRLIVENTQGEEVAAIDTEGNATFSGTLEADEVKTNEVIAGKIYADEIVARNGYFGQTNTSELSGITREEIEAILRSVESDQQLLAQASTWDIASATDSANLEELAVANLYVTEQAAVNSLSVTSAIALGPDLVLQSNSIDTLSAPLSIQSLALAPVEIMAGKVRVDTNGDVTISGNLYVAGQIESSGLTLKDGGFGDLLSLQDSLGDKVAAISATGSAEFNSVSTNKLIIAGAETTPQTADINQEIKTNATAGSAILLAGQTEITIRNPNISDYTLVYVTPTSSTQNNVLYIKAKGSGFFRVGFSGPLSQDVTFNWWVIDVNE